jgi:hypothetical protein
MPAAQAGRLRVERLVSLILQAVLASLALAWGTGILLAHLIAGPDIGATPAVLIPFLLIAGLAFSLIPLTSPRIRRDVMGGGALAAWIVVILFF